MDDTERAVLEATYRTLCERGYADLAMLRIVDESELSKAAIHYYASEEHLLASFLDYRYERYPERPDGVSGETQPGRLDALLTLQFAEEEANPGIDFRTALLERRPQAPSDDVLRETLRAFDGTVLSGSGLHETIAAGHETGAFEDHVDPDPAGDSLRTVIEGTHTRQVAVWHPARRSETTRACTDPSLVGENPSAVIA
ncbi:transcriptional regulator, TetR family [Halobiforma haloterrestris]|uniref:Transcriptional regulator, TetR family n=1 Tax=Natronobacterium haloterrestre TaxID=148448 RepID=A0A1I1JLS8_NATHA|nr:TetR family transcriptional regulator [Halobiforma haloterrestris]SFC49111.1 transcriptional regulator, TetR family [Halobiforma haloterrestris]